MGMNMPMGMFPGPMGMPGPMGIPGPVSRLEYILSLMWLMFRVWVRLCPVFVLVSMVSVVLSDQ